MNKADINNEIVLMRKTVRQAKIHIIRKLVREIRMLEGKKLPEDRIKKYKEKAEKLFEELTIIKKLDCDEVSKYSLTTADSSQLLLSNSNISIRDKALKRVAAHKTVNSRVKLIKEKYNISDNIEKVLEPGKKKLRKLKHIEGKAKKKQMKLDNAIAETQRKEWLNQHINVPNIPTKPSLANEISNRRKIKHDQDPVTKSNSKLIADSTNMFDSAQSSVHVNIEQDGKFDADQEDDIDTNQEDEVEKDHEDEVEKDYEDEIETDHEDILESSQEDNMNQEEEIEIKPEHKAKKKQALEYDNFTIKDPVAVKTIDDFFITDVGTHYESTLIPKNSVQVLTHNDGLNRQQRRAQMFGKIPKKKDKFRKNVKYAKSEKNILKHDTTNMLSIHKTYVANNNTDQLNIRKKVGKDIKEGNLKNTNVSLHPSWEAKKKLKPQITAFQGKKIVFDD